MGEVECEVVASPPSIEEFVNTGRTGRRNALPDILDSNVAAVGTGDLSVEMEKLQCAGGSGGTGKEGNPGPSTSQGGQGKKGGPS